MGGGGRRANHIGRAIWAINGHITGRVRSAVVRQHKRHSTRDGVCVPRRNKHRHRSDLRRLFEFVYQSCNRFASSAYIRNYAWPPLNDTPSKIYRSCRSQAGGRALRSLLFCSEIWVFFATSTNRHYARLPRVGSRHMRTTRCWRHGNGRLGPSHEAPLVVAAAWAIQFTAVQHAEAGYPRSCATTPLSQRRCVRSVEEPGFP